MDVQLKPLSLTLVEYIEGDDIGKVMAIVSLVPLILIPCSVTAFLLRRDIFIAYFGMGMVVNEVLNLVLKKSIKEARPVFDDYPAHIGVYGKHGMPSNHTQFTAYFANFVVLCLWKRWVVSASYDRLCKHIGTVLLYMLVFVVGYCRIYLRYHTLQQVVVGGLTGAGFAEIWFYLGNEVLRDALKATVQFPIAKWLYLKDTSDVDNVLLFEYQCYAKESERVQENETSDENRRKTD